jgi:hypothetical protein
MSFKWSHTHKTHFLCANTVYEQNRNKSEMPKLSPEPAPGPAVEVEALLVNKGAEDDFEGTTGIGEDKAMTGGSSEI